MGKIVGKPVEEISGIPGNIVLVQVKYENCSNEPWPNGCIIVKKAGNAEFNPIYIPEVAGPKEIINLTIPVKLPLKAGKYKLKLRLKMGSTFFGEMLKLKIKVQDQAGKAIKKPIDEFEDFEAL